MAPSLISILLAIGWAVAVFAIGFTFWWGLTIVTAAPRHHVWRPNVSGPLWAHGVMAWLIGLVTSGVLGFIGRVIGMVVGLNDWVLPDFLGWALASAIVLEIILFRAILKGLKIRVRPDPELPPAA